MKSLKSYIAESIASSKEHIQEAIKVRSTSKVNVQEYNYRPKTTDELKDIIKQLIDERGNEADLNDIDTSNITDMAKIFEYSTFNGDISKWDVSNVITMKGMFRRSKFTGDINNWDVKKVKDMFDMFYGCPLQKNPPKWYVS